MTAAINVKKKRGFNYTAAEKDMLLEIVKEHVAIIENKSYTGEMIRLKRLAWSEIGKQFNASATTGPRTWTQLRHLFENIKQRNKRKLANQIGPQLDEDNDVKDKAITEPNEKPAIDESQQIKDYLEKEKAIRERKEKYDMIKRQRLNEEKERALREIREKAFYEKVKEQKKRRRMEASHIGISRIETLQKQYYMQKLQNARFERGLIVQKHRLEMQLLDLKIKAVIMGLNIE